MDRYIKYGLFAGIICMIIMAGCKKEYTNQPTPYNSIRAFTIDYNATTKLNAIITGDSILVYWPGYKALPVSVTPEIIVSDNATVTPASGQAIDFKEGASYTVTAQDGSVAVYKLHINVLQSDPSLPEERLQVELGGTWEISGFSNLIPDTGLTKLYLIGKSGNEVNVPLNTIAYDNTTFLTTITTSPVSDAAVPTGYYKYKIVTNTRSLTSADSAIRVYARPVVSGFSPVKAGAGSTVTIMGKYFSATPGENIVLINETPAAVTAATATELKVTVPETAVTGKISVEVADYKGISDNNFIALTAGASAIEVFVGNGTNAIVDGTGTNAAIRSVNGMAYDKVTGNIYITGNGSHIIRKITPGGTVSAFAGVHAELGYSDGAGADARFYSPGGLVTDAAGNLYVADQWNNRIRKITPGGVVTTYAGSGGGGYQDGPAATAQFALPNQITIDAAGNLYVTGTTPCIRKITPDGQVSTIAGSATAALDILDGTGAAARFSNILSLTTGTDGNLYITDRYNSVSYIRKITPGGVVTTLSGAAGTGYVNGDIATAKFSTYTFGLAADGGSLYIADSFNNTIRKIQDGKVTTFAGSGLDGIFSLGTPSEAVITDPRWIIKANGAFYVWAANRILKITP